MQKRRSVYIIIGTILVVVNILADFLNLQELIRHLASFNIGYLIGSQILLIFGLILLRMAYKLQKKIQRQKKYNLDESIDNIRNLS